jgi:hypothetical protein
MNIKKSTCVLPSVGAICLAFGTSAAHAADIGARGCGELGVIGLDSFITSPVIKLTTSLLSPGDINVAIPINKVSTGEAGASAIAFNPFTKSKDNSKAGPANIFNPGPPPSVDTVSTKLVKASVFDADAEAQASISAGINKNGDEIFGVSAFTTTMCDADAYFGISSSAAIAKTDPFVFEPVASSGYKWLIEVDLLSNANDTLNPTLASLGLRATLPNPTVITQASWSYEVLVDGSSILDIDGILSTDDNGSQFSFSSLYSGGLGIIDAPPELSDWSFTSDGFIQLSPSKRFIRFTIPASTTDSLRLDIVNAGSASAVGVPGPLPILGVGVAFLRARMLRGRARMLRSQVKPDNFKSFQTLT